MTKYDLPLIASSGYVARVAETEYARCGTCEDVCPFEAVQVDGRAVVEWERCMGCGVCEGQCAHAAISRISDARKGAPRRMDVSQQLDFHQLFKYRLEAYHHVTFPAKRRRAILTGEVRQRVHYWFDEPECSDASTHRIGVVRLLSSGSPGYHVLVETNL